MKYFVMRVDNSAHELVFELGFMHHDHLTHADMAEAVLPKLAEVYNVPQESVTVVGAGFCNDGLPLKCWGHSDSLNVSTRGRADEDVLTSSMVNFQSAPHSGFDLMDSVNNNMSMTCMGHMQAMRDRRFVCLGETKCRDVRFYRHSLATTTVLQYGGPSLDTTGRPVHQFYLDAEDSDNEHYEYYESDDYARTFQIQPRDLKTVFADSELVRRFAKLINASDWVRVEVEGEIHRCRVVQVLDKWPLTDDHDEIVVELIDAEENKMRIVGSLTDLGDQIFGKE